VESALKLFLSVLASLSAGGISSEIVCGLEVRVKNQEINWINCPQPLDHPPLYSLYRFNSKSSVIHVSAEYTMFINISTTLFWSGYQYVFQSLSLIAISTYMRLLTHKCSHLTPTASICPSSTVVPVLQCHSLPSYLACRSKPPLYY
jgi:hypothetical protein